MLGSDSGKGAESVKSTSPEAPEWPGYTLPTGAKERDATDDVDLMFFRFTSDIDESGSTSSGVQLGIDGMDLEGSRSGGSSLHEGGVADALGLDFTTACTQEPASGASGYSCHTRTSSFGTSEPELYTSYLGPTFNPALQGHTNFPGPVPIGETFSLAYDAGPAAPCGVPRSVRCRRPKRGRRPTVVARIERLSTSFCSRWWKYRDIEAFAKAQAPFDRHTRRGWLHADSTRHYGQTYRHGGALPGKRGRLLIAVEVGHDALGTKR